MSRSLRAIYALAGLTGLLSAVEGRAAIPVPRINGAAVHSARTAAHRQAMSELHAAKSLLEKADHDYGGHRAKAVAHVNSAIHALGGGTNHTNAAGKTTRTQARQAGGKKAAGKAAGATKMPQATSDGHLKQAAQLLAASQKQLAGHAAAAGHVNNALSELQTALKIR